MKGLAKFLGGLAVGALVGMLIAPDKGSATRDRIKDCLRKRGILPTNEIDILIEELSADPEATFEEAQRPAEEKNAPVLKENKETKEEHKKHK